MSMTLSNQESCVLSEVKANVKMSPSQLDRFRCGSRSKKFLHLWRHASFVSFLCNALSLRSKRGIIESLPIRL